MRGFFNTLGALAFVLISVQAAAATKTFVYCSEGSPSTFNPQLASDGTTFNASSEPLYNRLVEFEPGGTKILPGLSESWTISKDGKTFTFKLRKNVKFHKTEHFTPTRNFNADDVVFTFERMMKKDHPYNKVSGGVYEYFKSMEMDTLIQEIKKVDDMTVQFVLSRPESPFLANLGMDFASIISAEYGAALQKTGKPEQLDTMPVGTGPFIFKSYVKDNTIRYTANADYWNGKPKIDQLVFSITPDASVRYQKLKRGECHFAAEPAPADVKNMRQDGTLQVLEREGMNVGYLAMNTQKKPFDNIKVRQAINLALNRKAYIEAIYLGNAIVAKNPLPPTIWGYNKSVQDYDFSPEKAKALLKEAGLEKGFEATLWTLPVSRPYNPNGKKMGELMQADLAKIGVKVNLMTYDWPTYLDKSRKGEHEMLLIGWTGDNGDPDNFLGVLLGCAGVDGGSNYARWCDKEFDNLIGEAKIITDVKKRTQLYEKAQTIFKKQAPWVTLAHSKVYRAMAKGVTGYKMSPFGTDQFDRVEIK